ncbi:MAG: ComEC/Rec2 family competence protein [Candidatus Buchananbacteria bacterium]
MNLAKICSLHKSQVLLFALIAFVVGIAVGSLLQIDKFIIFCLILILAAGLIFLLHKKIVFIIVLILLCLVLGIFRVQTNNIDCAKNDLICNSNGRQTKFLAKVYDNSQDIDGQKIKLSSQGVIVGNKIYPVKGNVLINQPLYPKYNYGDVLIVNCPLKAPEKFEDFDYPKYLAAKDIYSICPYGEVRKINSGQGFWLKGSVLKIKDKLSNSFKRSINEPQSSIIRAMILNETGDIPQNWNDTFSNLGLTHIIAISGSHITIIVSLIMYLAIALGLMRQKAFWAAAIGILVYIIMIGFPASAVRAAIMGILVIYGQKIGRSGSSEMLIILAASLMLVLNPLLLLYDVGFQLSFLAVIGLIYLSPFVERWLKIIPDFFQVREMLTATIAAQIITLPLIIFQFGRFSPISILANILILPIIPFLTVFAILNAIIGAIIPFVGNIMGWVSWLFTFYWLEVSYLMKKINFFSFSFKMSWWAIFLCYILIGLCIFKFKNKNKNIDL